MQNRIQSLGFFSNTYVRFFFFFFWFFFVFCFFFLSFISELFEKYNVSLRKLLQKGISETEFYGDLIYRIRKIVGKSNVSE